MKNYTITTNGKAYAITVEEGAVSGITIAPAASVVLAAPVAPAPAPATTPIPVVALAGAAGSVSVSASISDRVMTVRAAVGQVAKKGDVTLVLETMKMKGDIMTPQDGTITSINASTSGSVESGVILATLS